MLVLISHDPFIDVVRPTRITRLAAAMHSHHLDMELAHGADPDSTVRRALRARQLTRGKRRHTLANGLRRSLRNPPPLPRAPRGVSAANEAQYAAVLAAQPELLDLITAVERPGPVTARGMALVSLLVTEGGGPLHCGANVRLLRDRCREALVHLTPHS